MAAAVSSVRRPDGQVAPPDGTVQTGIVLLNLGGPETLDDVEPFLCRLFDDRELLRLPFQSVLGRFIATRRAPKVRQLYAAIGGGSPIRRITEAQGEALAARLDRLSPATAPHRAYVAFRYAPPFAQDALLRMHADGVRRAIAFSQYPQYSCTTTGSSLNELWRQAGRLGLARAFAWSVIDRWPVHDGFIDAMVACVREALVQVPEPARTTVPLLFSAHSLPLSVIDRGDHYPQEVAASVQRVIERGGFTQPYQLCYQSEVGPVRWLGPSTEATLRAMARRGRREAVVIPIAFTSDHIETLSELDLEYGHMVAALGMTHFVRAPALNLRPDFLDALADLVHGHLRAGERHSRRYPLRCPTCVNPECRRVLNPVGATAAAPA